MLKELEEKRAELQNEMEQILAKAKEEKRAINEEESARFDEIEKEIGAIDKTMAAEKRATELAAEKKVEEDNMQTEQRAEENEVRAFEDYLRGGYETVCKTTAPQSESVLRDGAIDALSAFMSK